MPWLTAHDTAPRVRAARAWADLDQRELSNRSGVSYDRIRAIEAGDRERRSRQPRVAQVEELRAIGEACSVPRWFMEAGFELPDIDPEELDRQVHDPAMGSGGFIALVYRRVLELQAQLELLSQDTSKPQRS
jgi:transcriptional regulator with XRE-family HTH domain